MHVSRPEYALQLSTLLAEFPAVAVLGPRQCGKTTLAADYLKVQAPTGLYLDLERPRDALRLTDPDLFLSGLQDRLVCLDEVQRMPGLLPVLRSLIDADRRPGRFLLLGSASPDLRRLGAESLAGRLATIELSPFTVAEAQSAGFDVQAHWLRGGFPPSLLAQGDAASVRWREAFIATFLERDLALLGIRTTAEAMGRFWHMAAHLNGQLLNLSSLANALDVSHTTVRTRVDEMVGSYMLRLLAPLASNLGKRLVKSPKLYVRDSGLLHSLLTIPDRAALFAHPTFGSSWEGYVIQQVLNTASGWRASFYRTAAGAELDLVLERGGRRVAIECKASSAPTLTRGFWSALRDLDIQEAYVVAPVLEAWPLERRVTVIPVGDVAAVLDGGTSSR
ncbi:MAG: ATP-binding protein [Ardenticatenales bacterium]